MIENQTASNEIDTNTMVAESPNDTKSIEVTTTTNREDNPIPIEKSNELNVDDNRMVENQMASNEIDTNNMVIESPNGTKPIEEVTTTTNREDTRRCCWNE